MHRVGYYAIPRDGPDNTVKSLQVQDIDPFICTHIIVAFASVENADIKPDDESDIKVYKDVMSLKTQNPELKVLLSLGGGSCTTGFPALVRDPEAVIKFASNTKIFLEQYGFDGVDLDWEFPAWPCWKSDPREKQGFTNLVEQLSLQLKSSSTNSLLLTIAVAGVKNITDSSYEVDKLAKYVDFVSMMGYDYHMFQPYLPFTGHNAPLFKHQSQHFCLAKLNIAWMAQYWLEKGMPKEKLVIGVPTYGRTWKLLNRVWHGVAAPAVGEGMLGGTLSYPQAYFFIQEGSEECFDERCRVPYTWRGRDWVSFENSQSIREKAVWIRDFGYAGIMTWNLNCDDWAGVCQGKKFELHNIIKDVVNQEKYND